MFPASWGLMKVIIKVNIMKKFVVFFAFLTMITFPIHTSAYSYSGHHWDYGNPTYVDVTILSEVPVAWDNAIAYAMSAWNKAGAKFHFRVGNAGHTIGFKNLWQYPDALAVTYVRESSSTMRITDKDTDISSRYSWDVNGVSYKYDVQNVMTHEFGHWLNLGDLKNSWDYWKTMYGSAAPGEIYKRTLETDDINGIRAIYGIY